MPRVEVVFFKEDDGSVPMRAWLDGVPKKVQAKCLARLKRLEELGHELRRPEADYLRDDIHELRVGLQGVNYRLLYFFHGRMAAVCSHGLMKERAVPRGEIDLAVQRKRKFEKDPPRTWSDEHGQEEKPLPVEVATSGLRPLYRRRPAAAGGVRRGARQRRRGTEDLRAAYQGRALPAPWRNSWERRLPLFANWKAPSIRGTRSPCFAASRRRSTNAWRFASCGSNAGPCQPDVGSRIAPPEVGTQSRPSRVMTMGHRIRVPARPRHTYSSSSSRACGTCTRLSGSSPL